MKKMFALVLSLMLILSMFAGCSTPAAPSPSASPAPEVESTPAETAGTEEPVEAKLGEGKKIAWICSGVLTDGGWNEDAYRKINELAEEHGFELSYQESVESTDVVDVLRNYGASGYDLVISNYQYHCEDMASVAPEFPNVTFGCVNGYVSTDNMIAITGDMWGHNYLAGVMAGMVTKSNKLGLITYSTDSDSALTIKKSWEAGAKSVNPDIEIIHVATGSFSDLAIGKEMAISLIDQGCDVIMANSGNCNATVCEVCIENQVYTISSLADRNGMSPEYMLGSALLPSDRIEEIMVTGFLDGSLKGSSEVIVLGIAEGAEELRINPDLKIDQSILDAIEQAKQDIISGKVTFTL